jgi:hypothetical protein
MEENPREQTAAMLEMVPSLRRLHEGHINARAGTWIRPR